MRADLTDDFIAGLTATGKLYRVFDLTLRTLCIAVAPGGSKRWYIRNGEAWQTLGKWPEVDSRAARAGTHGERSAFWDRLEAHCERVKPSTARTYRLIIVHWQTALAGLRIDQLTPSQIRDRLPDGSNRWRNQCLAVLSLGYNLAGIENPVSARRIRRDPEVERTRLLPESQLRELFRDLETHGSHGHLIRFLLLSGLRLGEALGIQAGHIVWDDSAVWLMVAKAGQRMVYLGAGAMDELRHAPFDPVGLKHWWNRYRESHGIGWLRVHDIRRLVASSLLKRGHPVAEIGIMLGHRPGSAMTVRYARLAGSKKIGSRLGAAIHKVLG